MHFPGVSSEDQPEQTDSALSCPPAGLLSSPLPSLGRERASVPVCRCLPNPKPGPSHHSPVPLAPRSCFKVLERNLSPSRLGADRILASAPLLPAAVGVWQCCLRGLAHPIPAAEELSLNFRDPPRAAELPLLQIVYQSDSSPLQPVLSTRAWSHALCWGLSPSCLQPSSPPCAFLSLPGSASSLLSPRAPAKSRAYRAKRPSLAPQVPRRANPAPCRDGRSS